MKTERIAIRITKQAKKKLEMVAKLNKRKYSDQARIFIEDALDKLKTKE